MLATYRAVVLFTKKETWTDSDNLFYQAMHKGLVNKVGQQGWSTRLIKE